MNTALALRANSRMPKATRVEIPRIPQAEQWADQICTQHGKSVESIIDVGRLLLKAKRELVRGEWGRMFEENLVPFAQSTASHLMAIASNAVLTNLSHVTSLPPSWGTLYELSRVEPKRLAAAFKDGIITPDMKRKEVLPPGQALLGCNNSQGKSFERDCQIRSNPRLAVPFALRGTNQ